MVPNILIFGTKNCRFCTKQLEYLKATYGEQSKNWVFIDVASNNEMMKIAQEAKVETIPSVVILNKKNQIILQRKGTISPDEIFFRQSLHKESGISLPFAFVPFTDEEVSYLLNGNKSYGLFSSSFNLKEGITAEAHRYNSTLDKISKSILGSK
jgi:glutaredoxin